MRSHLIYEKAQSLGFDMIGIAPLDPAIDGGAFLHWLEAGQHGEMAYLARKDAVEKRLDPGLIVSGAQTAIVVGLSYETLAVPMQVLQDPRRGRIARYAWGVDYHDIMTPVLRNFGEWLQSESRAYVDTGPVLERAWAERAGLGFIGKNTCLINRERGSYLFLGVILIADRVDDEKPLRINKPASTITCGSCTRCLTACPTDAFPAPGVLDARRCISYLTIELKGEIPEALRPKMGNWVFGCDVCQDVCPYVRRFSAPGRSVLSAAFQPDTLERAAPWLADLLLLDAAAFKAQFGKSPIARAKRRGLLRNTCVAAGNSGDSTLQPLLEKMAENVNEDSLIRQHASWAARRI